MKKSTLLIMMSIAAGTALLAQAPADLSVCYGKGYTLTSTKDATGTSQVSYQWYENDNLLDGENEASLSIAAGKAVGDYAYWRMASNEACPDGIASNTFTVRVLAAGANGQPPDPTCGCITGLNLCAGTCYASSGATVTFCDSFTFVNDALDHGHMTWSDAYNWCTSQGLRLPTRDELWCITTNPTCLPLGAQSGYYWTSGLCNTFEGETRYCTRQYPGGREWSQNENSVNYVFCGK